MAPPQKPRYVMVEGLRFVEGFIPHTVRSALRYQPRPNDVFVVTYPKCGTTWMMQIVLLILHEGELPETTQEYFACTPYLEMLGADTVGKMPRPSPIRSHLPFDMIPYADYAKYVYVARHPRDCCISLYQQVKMFPAYGYSGSFDDFFELFINGETDYTDYFDHVLSWYEHRHDPNVFFITYEQLKADTEGAVRQIAEFLGDYYGKMIKERRDIVNKILRYSSFDFMRQDTFNLWKEALKIPNEGFSEENLPPGIVSWAESAVDSHYGHKLPTLNLNVRDLMRRSSLYEWDTTLSRKQERKLRERIREKTKNSDLMNLWNE